MLQQYWIFIYIGIAITVTNGHVQDLRVNVMPVQSRFALVQNVNVVLKYTNVGSDTMSIYKWFLPEGTLYDELFEITRDGHPVEYVGPVVKRRVPIAEDLINLTPGMEISSVVDLSSVYNMTQSGNYIIQYKMNATQVLFTVDNVLSRRLSILNDDDAVVRSDPVVVFSTGRRNHLIEEAARFNTQSRALTPTFIGCSSSQSTAINSAMLSAEAYNNGALQHLNTLAAGSTRYTTWFGTVSSSNRATLQSHFTKIKNALSTKTVSFDCTCPANKPDSVYAYVYPILAYRVYLCNAFWRAPLTGTDSKSGTIIHELAHFIVLAGTSDHGYGQSTCKTLAQKSPTKAIKNSDSLQYYAENNPRLN